MPNLEPKHIRVLVCEDHSKHQNLLLLALVKHRPRVDVTVVRSGSEMLEAIAETRFDCVVLDYCLDPGRATDLIRSVFDKLERCPVLVISSSEEQSLAIERMCGGVIESIPKAEAIRGDMLWRRIAWSVKQARKNRQDRRRAERRERCLAMESETDPLTGLNNRQYVDRLLRQGRWVGDRRKHHCSLMFDIDHLKSINDRYGCTAGDMVLREVATIVREHAGASGIAVRWGNDEFLVVCPMADHADCLLGAERLRSKIAQAVVKYQSEEIRVTASIGVVHVHADELSIETIERCNQAMYMAKRWGRDRVCTGQMVLLDRALDELAVAPDASIERKRWMLLRQIEKILGPTQWEHVTQHGARVSDTACRMAHAIGMTIDQIDQVRVAALLHDIGKCLIPESVLAKPCSLAFDELRLIAEHAELSAWIADRLGADPEVVRMIRNHHKRFDRARAEGLLPSMFPIGGRVICVADALVTMTTDRPYRSRLSFSDAVSELQRERGAQFDPMVVDVVWFARTGSILEAA